MSKTNNSLEAQNSFEEAVRLMPHESVNHSNLGVTLAVAGDWNSAEQEARNALELDSKKLIYIPNGGEGNVRVVHQDSPDQYTTVATVATFAGAKTIAVDPVTHNAYIFQPERGPAPVPAAGAPPTATGTPGRDPRGPTLAAWFIDQTVVYCGCEATNHGGAKAGLTDEAAERIASDRNVHSRFGLGTDPRCVIRRRA